MNIRFLTILIIVFIFFKINAQIQYEGTPLSFKEHLTKSVSVYQTPYFDYSLMLQEDEENKSGAKPYRFGKVHHVNINPENSGTWTVLSSGKKIWQLHIHSDQAYAIGLFFKQFKLNKGVQFFVYTQDRSIVKGAFTSLNNKKNNVFSVLPIAGEDIILELNIAENTSYGIFELSSIIHDYKNAFGKKLKSTKSSGSCNVNVNCPEGADWQKEKRSVVKYTFIDGGSTYMCTGALINNVRQDATPYLLTANHCVSSQTVASSGVFIFNYESELCNGTTGPANQTISSSDLIATPASFSLDFSLLKLSTDPPIEYKPYYAGWNRDTAPASQTVTIHHPSGDIKKISFDYDPPVTGDYGSGTIANSHWNILAWDLGTTEGGSSGSPLFDQYHRIVGDLTGGQASCSYNFDDYYAKFDMSWDYYPETNHQLKAWLDPDNTGAVFIDGFDPYAPVDSFDIKLVEINEPVGTFCSENLITPKIDLQNNGVATINSFSLYYSLNNNIEDIYNWSGSLASGATLSIQLPSFHVSSGAGTFKIYSSNPNNKPDENTSNDTLVSNFQADTILENIKIKGDEYICSETLRGTYSVDESGYYSWAVNAGKIISGNNSDSISVQWNAWGNRKVELSVNNACGAYTAESITVNPVSESIVLQLNTQNYPVSWILTQQDNDFSLAGNIPAGSGNVSVPICLQSACYTLKLIGDANCNDCSFSVNDAQSKLLVSGNYSDSQQNISFCVNNQIEAIYNVYPNPAKNQISIEANFVEAYKNATFTVYTLSGAVRIPENKLNGATQIDISELEKGYYLLKIQSDFGDYTKSFVKQ